VARPVSAVGSATANDPRQIIFILLAAAQASAVANDPTTIPSAVVFVPGAEAWFSPGRERVWRAAERARAWAAEARERTWRGGSG